MPYYPKEYALRELTQLYSFTSLKVIQNHPHTEKEINEQNDIHHGKQNKKTTTTQNNTKKLDQKIPQKERKNRKMVKKIFHKNKSRNQNIESYHDLEINHVKTTKHSSHNLKY